ncbi:transposase [Paenibacillus abyssi]|uniref:Uncharacterized protein n=1 Tax=Paenibacillus abyssi TaxID=1340531 RepID=A0A917LHE8_9BACL|nr:transposase [Paenibacillus abyssi]GGG23603.1 hypothetical protein GCM10010916_45190 [Paenibacillus abyssi]
MSDKHSEMNPVSGEKVEVDGIYQTEWGREEELKRGERFPADPILGNTEWDLKELSYDNHHEGRTDPRLVPKKEDPTNKNLSSPRGHIDRGDK